MARLIRRLVDWDVRLSARLAGPPGAAAEGDRFVWMAAHLGDSWLWALIWFGCWRGARGERRALLLHWLAAMAVAAAAVTGIKLLVKRPRPGRAAWLYGPGADTHSFPSGHAARLSVGAVFGDRLVSGGHFWGWLLALAVGLSRVRLGIHYLGDVLAGLVLGAAIGRLAQRAASGCRYDAGSSLSRWAKSTK